MQYLTFVHFAIGEAMIHFMGKGKNNFLFSKRIRFSFIYIDEEGFGHDAIYRNRKTNPTGYIFIYYLLTLLAQSDTFLLHQ